MRRGQFYLVAVLVIIVVMSGLTQVYTRARAPAADKTTEELAEEIYYETGQLINNRAFAGNTANQIRQEIKTFVGYYADNNDMSIAIVYGDETLAYFINSTDIKDIVPAAGIAQFIFSGSEYEVDMNDKGLYVLILRERLEERSVVVK